MTDLDLGRIKEITADLDDESCSDSVWMQRAVRVVSQVPRLIAEVDKLHAEIARLELLLGANPYPSSDAFEAAMQALADERAVTGQLRSLLAEVLDHFRPYGTSVRSGEVLAETFARWRSIAERGGQA